MTIQTEIKHIPLRGLVVAKRNVRKTTSLSKTEQKARHKALKASLLAHGVLQSLVVVPRKGDGYELTWQFTYS